MLVIHHAALSDAGLHHVHNEDRWYAQPEWGLYFVSDGMANEATPQFLVEELPQLIHQQMASSTNVAEPQTAWLLQGLLLRFNERVRAKHFDAGATLVLALVRSGQALLAHLGDSRIYLHRGGQLEQLTRDHSVVQEMLDRGLLTPAEAAADRWNGGPTRFVGMLGKAVADVRWLTLQPGDRLLLCSDGLTEMLFDEDIRAILNRSPDLQTTCQHLVDAANVAGGYDNITVLLIAGD
jgi:serine/threonine protein phosphatase PrpC